VVAACMRRAPGAWSPRAGRHGGESAVSPTVASRSQGQPREHQRGCRGDVGQVGRGGAYPSGGTAGRQRKNFGVGVFVDGEGLRWSPVEVMKSCSSGEVRE
jgi:hypothetical protein